MYRCHNSSLIRSQLKGNDPSVETDYLDVVLDKVAGVIGALGVFDNLLPSVGSFRPTRLDVLVTLKSFTQSLSSSEYPAAFRF